MDSSSMGFSWSTMYFFFSSVGAGCTERCFLIWFVSKLAHSKFSSQPQAQKFKKTFNFSIWTGAAQSGLLIFQEGKGLQGAPRPRHGGRLETRASFFLLPPIKKNESTRHQRNDWRRKTYTSKKGLAVNSTHFNLAPRAPIRLHGQTNDE